MLSKRAVLAALLLVLPLGGCSYFKDTRKPKDVIEIKAAKGTRSCLSRSVNVLTQYFRRSGAGVADTEQIIDCAVESIELFEKNVRGDQVGRYSGQELATFIDRFFPDTIKNTSETIPIFLRLKSSMLGGSSEFLTRDELVLIRKIILSFKDAAGKLEPYADIYGLNAGKTVDEAKFDHAVEVLDQTVATLVEPLPKQTHVSFHVSDLQKLLATFDGTKAAESFTPLAMSIKQIVLQPPATSIGGSEWRATFKAAAKMYSVFLRYKYFVEHEPVLADANPKHCEKIVLGGIEILRDSIKGRADKPINGTEFALLIDELSNKKYLPGKLRATSLKRLIWPAVVRLLQKGPRAYRPSGKSLDELIPQAKMGLEQLGVLEYDVKDFFAGHRMSYALTHSNANYSSARVGAAYSSPDLHETAVTGMDSSAVNWAAESMRTILSGTGRFLTYDDQDRLLIVPNEQIASVSREDLVNMNAARVLVQMIVRGYSGHLYPWRDRNGLSEDQTQEFYLDVRSLGVDLDLMDSRVTTAGVRSFMEGNLFTSVSNGDGHLSSHEALEFFSTIMSAGKIASRLYDESIETCRKPNLRKDITGREMLPAECFREHFKKTFAHHFGNLPGMVRFVSSISGDQEAWLKFVTALESASRAGGYNNGPYEFADLRVLSTVLHYAESVFTNYDSDQDEILAESEINSAFPTFQEFLRRLSGTNSAYTQRKIFSFMIRAGRPPTGKKELALWMAGDLFVRVKADRSDITGIMASLSIHSRDRKLGEIDKYLKSNLMTLQTRMAKQDEFTARQLMILFQCDPTDAKPMQSLMRDHGRNWFQQPYSSTVFTQRVDAAIKRDQKLSRMCVPLF